MCSRNVRETVSLISRQNILCALKIANREDWHSRAALSFEKKIFYNSRRKRSFKIKFRLENRDNFNARAKKGYDSLK